MYDDNGLKARYRQNEASAGLYWRLRGAHGSSSNMGHVTALKSHSTQPFLKYKSTESSNRPDRPPAHGLDDWSIRTVVKSIGSGKKHPQDGGVHSQVPVAATLTSTRLRGSSCLHGLADGGRHGFRCGAQGGIRDVGVPHRGFWAAVA